MKVVPQLVSAGATGVATGLLGTVIPIVGLAGGVIMQLAEKDVPAFRRVEGITEGVVDGSAALLARTLVLGLKSAPARGYAVDAWAKGRGQVNGSDAQGLVGRG